MARVSWKKENVISLLGRLLEEDCHTDFINKKKQNKTDLYGIKSLVTNTTSLELKSGIYFGI